MAKEIVVVGVGGTSRDLIELLEAINEGKRHWDIIGLLDDDPAVHGTEVFGYPVLGSTQLIRSDRLANVNVAIGVANERQLLIRKQIRSRLALPPERYPALVHPTASVSRRSRVSEGAVIMAGVSCSGRVAIGSGVIILQNCAIGHEAQLADFSSVSITVSIGGSAQIGEGAYLGIGSSILPGCKIGKQAIVGMGAVVIRDVPNYAVVVGNPARVISISD